MNLSEQIEMSQQNAMHGMDVPWLLRQWADRTPDKPAMIWCPFAGEEKVWSYAELLQQSIQIAAGLKDRGIAAGDYVLIHLDDSPEFVLSWYACALIGAVAVSTNTHSVARDMSYFSKVTEAVCAITQPQFAQLLRQSCPNLKFIAVTNNDAGEIRNDAATIQSEVDGIPFEALYSSTALDRLTVDPQRNLSVQFTSGTTSRPKAVLWSHANALWAGKISAQHMRLQQSDITLIYMPLFHTNAQGYSMLATHWSGGTIVVQPRFSSSRFWAVCLKHRISWASMIPFAYKALMTQAVPDHQMRFWGGPASLPAIGAHFKVSTIGWWGMTETLTHGIVTDIDHPGPHGTLGRVAPEYQIQLRKSDGSLAEAGEKGVLHIRGVRGVSLFKEYYRNPEANETSFDSNGWFDTGDLVRMDENGWLYFSDREKDMLKVGAENVAASEIESVIMQTGLVDECAVVAQKHFMLDEVPVVFLIPNTSGLALTEQELKDRVIEYCRENLADFKVVRDVHIVDALPRSTLEKIAKNELRTQLTPITE